MNINIKFYTDDGMNNIRRFIQKEGWIIQDISTDGIGYNWKINLNDKIVNIVDDFQDQEYYYYEDAPEALEHVLLNNIRLN